MSKVVFAACLLIAGSLSGSLAFGKDPTILTLSKGARVGLVSLMDPEITHYHAAKALTNRFLKTESVNWRVDSMLPTAVAQRLTELGLVAVPVGPTDALARGRDDYFVNNSVAKGLPRACAKDFADLAAANHLDALIVLAPGLNNSSQAGPDVQKALPDYLRGWVYVTADSAEKPHLFNMTQLLLIAATGDAATLEAREWGGRYTDIWADYLPPPDPKATPDDELEKVQPLFQQLLSRQAAHLLEWISVP
jgi:hypothetical protein